MYLNGACYLRVSTDDQTEYSLDAQLKLIKNYAKQNQIILTQEHIYIDEGISGKRADKRPEFMKMIGMSKLKPKPFDIILVHKFDRFARSREDSVVYKSLLRKEAGIKVVSITESIEDDKFSVILEAMLEAMAEYYSLNLAEEVKKGMTEKAHRGEYQSIAPFGYAMKDGKLEINSDEAPYVNYIFDKFVSGELGMRQLAIKLNDFAIKTHRGNSFESRNIEYILNNPVYVGQTRWNPEGKTKRKYDAPSLIIKDGKHTPIISRELWEKAQSRLQRNKELYKPREKNTTKINTWVKGLVRCAECNKMLVSSNIGYLQCNGYVKGQCTTTQFIKAKTIEELIVDELKTTFENSLPLNIVPKKSETVVSNEYEFLTLSLDKLGEKEDRIKIAYQDGIDTLEEYQEGRIAIAQERERLTADLTLLKENLTAVDSSKDNIYQRISNVYELISGDTDVKVKYEVAHFLIEEIKFSKGKKILELTYK